MQIPVGVNHEVNAHLLEPDAQKGPRDRNDPSIQIHEKCGRDLLHIRRRLPRVDEIWCGAVFGKVIRLAV
jgi:hypothetical protein